MAVSKNEDDNVEVKVFKIQAEGRTPVKTGKPTDNNRKVGLSHSTLNFMITVNGKEVKVKNMN